MEDTIKINLNATTVENLRYFAKYLEKDPSDIINEALEQYFENEQEKLQAKTLDFDNGMSNLDFKEFWDGVDI